MEIVPLINRDGNLIGIQSRESRFGGVLCSRFQEFMPHFQRLRNGEVFGAWPPGTEPVKLTKSTASLAITRLAALQPSAREALFELDRGALVRLARNLDGPQLDSLSRYLTSLEKGPAQRILSAVAQSPARMAELSPPRVRDAIIASRDQRPPFP
ncbi:hypothetical protein HC762_00915 [bacterium]|nr:hypothetical protein [bacterium]